MMAPIETRRQDFILERVLDVILALCDEMTSPTDNFDGMAAGDAAVSTVFTEEPRNDYIPENTPETANL
jgi:hypothetical protein